jgi:heat shock protein HslJ
MRRTAHFAILLWALCSCRGNTQPQSASDIVTDTVAIVSASDTLPNFSDNSRNSLAWKGTYVGMLPIAKGNEVTVALTLAEDSFEWEQQPGDGTSLWFTTRGKFQWNTGGNQIFFNVSSDTFHFIVGENRLIWLDKAGRKVQRNETQIYELYQKNSPSAQQYPITETKWILQEINASAHTSHLPENSYYVVLRASDNRFQAFMGCNLLFGTYDITADNAIRFSPLSGTRKTCSDMRTELLFGELMPKVTHYRLYSHSWLLYENDKLLLKFTALTPK